MRAAASILALLFAACSSFAGNTDRLIGAFDHLYRPTDAKSSRVSKVSSIAAGTTLTVGGITGPAVIRRVWFTAQSPVPPIYGMLILRIYWDGETHPSVEAPLGDFFGVGFGQERDLKSAMTEMLPAGMPNHAALLCYWPMPFRRSCRITVENRSRRQVPMFFAQVSFETGAVAEDDLLFHAMWRRENPVTLHQPHTILEATGRGRYAGTVLSYNLLGPGAYVEGGDDFYVDGATSPTLPGIGAEDYFGQSWGFRHERNGFFSGTSFGPDENRLTAYRWHIPDPVHFEKSIRVTMRCHGWDVGDRQDDYASVAFWYQGEPHAPFAPLPEPDNNYLKLPEEYRVAAADRLKTAKLPPLPPGRNLAPEANAWRESSHYDTDSSAPAAFDGRIDTKWCARLTSDGAWLALDLGTARELTGAVVKNASTAGEPEGFDTDAARIETAPSLEGPWKQSAEISLRNAPLDPEWRKALMIMRFESPVRARCIRLVVTDPGELDRITRIPEFEVYGD